MTQFLFDRDWAVTIADDVTKPGGKKYTSIKVTFDIDKTSYFTSNKAKIEIYNLTPNSQAQLKKGLQIRLDAGYKGLMETLFLGNMTIAKTKRNGPDIITTIECGEGEKEIANSHFDKSYPAGTSTTAIITDVANAMGVDLGTVLGLTPVIYNSGTTFIGSCAKILNRLVRNQGLEWSVQNNALQIIPVGSHNGDEAIEVSKATGMIGVPSQGADFVQFTSLLNPKIVPGAPILLKSDNFNGVYKVRRGHYEGDSHGDKWQVTTECVPIKATQALAFTSLAGSVA